MYFVPCNSSNNSFMFRMGNLFFTVNSFSFLQSMHNLQELSFFLTSSIGEAKGLVLCIIILFESMSVTYFSISVFWEWGYLYGLSLNGSAPGLRMIRWSNSLSGDSPFGVANTWGIVAGLFLLFPGESPLDSLLVLPARLHNFSAFPV